MIMKSLRNILLYSITGRVVKCIPTLAQFLPINKLLLVSLIIFSNFPVLSGEILTPLSTSQNNPGEALAPLSRSQNNSGEILTPSSTSQNNSSVNSENLSENYYRPTMYQPFIVIDCGRRQTVFSKTCFRAIDKVSRKVRASGKFKTVYSISTFSFMYESNQKMYSASLEKFHPYKHKRMSAFLKKRYPWQWRQLAGSKGRYAVIYVEKKPKKVEKRDRANWTEYARRKKIDVNFSDDPQFKRIFKKHFLDLYLVVKIDYPEKLSEKNLIIRMRKLAAMFYKIPYVKQVFSPWHSKRALSLFSIFKNKKRYKNYWELTGKEASLTWNVKTNVVYLLLFSKADSKINDYSINKTLRKFHKTRKAKWVIYGQNYKILRKSVDDLKQDKGITPDVKKRTGRINESSKPKEKINASL